MSCHFVEADACLRVLSPARIDADQAGFRRGAMAIQRPFAIALILVKATGGFCARPLVPQPASDAMSDGGGRRHVSNARDRSHP
jgi:hypothetical protein